MAHGIDEVEIQRWAETQPLVRLCVLPCVLEVGRQVGPVIQISVHQVGVKLIVLHPLDVGVCRLPVLSRRVAESHHQLMGLPAILRMDENVDIAEGTQLRHRIQLPQIVPLHRHMGNAVGSELLGQLLERRAAVEVPRDRAVQDRVQLLLYIVCRKELPALVLIGQHRQQILPQSGLAQRGNIPRLSALRRRIMYKAAEQREEL